MIIILSNLLGVPGKYGQKQWELNDKIVAKIVQISGDTQQI